MRLNSFLLAYCLLFSCCLVYSTYGQNPDSFVATKVQRVVSDKTYDSVLDLVFPRLVQDEKKTDWNLVLRFKPNSGPESQIVIRKTTVGFEVTEYRSLNGGIFGILNEAFTKTDIEDPLEMSALIRVNRRTIEINQARPRQWVTGFFSSMLSTAEVVRRKSGEFDRTGSWLVQLHGTKYEVWYSHVDEHINLTVIDEEVNDAISGRTPLSRWMNTVRIAVSKAKGIFRK